MITYRLTKRVALLIALASVAGLGGCDHDHSVNPWHGSRETYSEEFERNLDGDNVSLLYAESTNGTITARESDQQQILVRIRKKVRAPSYEEARHFAGRVRVETRRVGNKINIYTTYPDPPDHVDVSVEYTIDFPAGIDLDVRTLNGAIQIDGATGAIEARTLNGNIDADIARLRGQATLATTNGNIALDARRGAAQVTATVVNGAVTAILPADLSGRLSAQTVTGRVRCDLPLIDPTVEEPNRIVGTFGGGDGDTPVTLQTVNGNVYVGKH